MDKSQKQKICGSMLFYIIAFLNEKSNAMEKGRKLKITRRKLSAEKGKHQK